MISLIGFSVSFLGVDSKVVWEEASWTILTMSAFLALEGTLILFSLQNAFSFATVHLL